MGCHQATVGPPRSTFSSQAGVVLVSRQGSRLDEHRQPTPVQFLLEIEVDVEKHLETLTQHEHDTALVRKTYQLGAGFEAAMGATEARTRSSAAMAGPSAAEPRTLAGARDGVP